MTSPTSDPSGPEEGGFGGPGRRRTLLALCVVAAAAAAGWYVWRIKNAVEPPSVELVDADPTLTKAVGDARQAVKNSPASATAWGRLGMLYLAHAFMPEAEICLAQAAKLDPHDGGWAYLHALILLQTNREQSIPALEHAVTLFGNIAAPRLKLAEVLLEQGRLDEAEKNFSAVLEFDPDNPRAELGLGRAAYLRGNWKESLEHLKRSEEGAPGVRPTHALLAEVYQRLGNTKTAEQQLRRVAETSDDLVWPDPYLEPVERLKTGVQARVNLAGSLMLQGRAREAIGLVEETVRSRPDSHVAHLAYGRLLLKTSASAAAEAEFREAARLRPDDAVTQAELASALKREGKFREAADCYRKVVQLKPSHALAYYSLGLCLDQLGDLPGAIQALQKAVKYRPDLADGHRALGELLARNGEFEPAANHLQDALRLDPSDQVASKLLARVRQQKAQRGRR